MSVNRYAAGGAAFPTTDYYDERPIGSGAGMTLRDYFAAKAMQAICGNNETLRAILNLSNEPATAAANLAYQWADAMLEERAK